MHPAGARRDAYGQPPARLTVEQVACVLNCRPHDVPVLVNAKLLKPLGHPPANSVKFFAAADLLEQMKDRSWLSKVTNAICLHWQHKNARQRSRLRESATNEGLCLPIVTNDKTA